MHSATSDSAVIIMGHFALSWKTVWLILRDPFIHSFVDSITELANTVPSEFAYTKVDIKVMALLEEQRREGRRKLPVVTLQPQTIDTAFETSCRMASKVSEEFCTK